MLLTAVRISMAHPCNFLRLLLGWAVGEPYFVTPAMGFFKILLWQVFLALAALQKVQCSVFIHFNRVPPARTRLSTAVFLYSIIDQDGQNPCRISRCSLFCEIDNTALKSCSQPILLRNLTQNQSHMLFLNVTTSVGERNSSAYKWYIDTKRPTASIFTEKNLTNAANAKIVITFSEACTGLGGFKCLNSSSCDVSVRGPAGLNASSLQMIEPNMKYSLVIDFSTSSIYGYVAVEMADRFCTDEAGNFFTAKNTSLVIHFDRRPVNVDLWMSVPSYELEIGTVPRTVIATNKWKDLHIFMEFTDPVMNSTEEILSVLHATSGYLACLPSGNHGNRRFGFELKNVSGTEIITIKLQSNFLFGRSGTAVSSVHPFVFLYDSRKPTVKLSTSSFVTKENEINVLVEFSKPVFGFEASGIEVGGGRFARFKELSKAVYSFTILDVSQNLVSAVVPEGKAKDIAGNHNAASNLLVVRHYSTPGVSLVLQPFATAGLFATSLASAFLALSSANLAAIGGLSSSTSHAVTSDPSRNLLGMIGHLQVFVLSDFLSVNLPTEYSETTKGLRWLIPRQKLPWKKEDMLIRPNYTSAHYGQKKIPTENGEMSRDYSLGTLVMKNSLGTNSSCFSSIVKEQMETQICATSLPGYPQRCGHWRPTNDITSSPCGSVDEQQSLQNIDMKRIPYGLPLDSSEYFIYLLRGLPFSAGNLSKNMQNHTGWQDFEMNMFWLAIGCSGLFVVHLMVLCFLRWRTGTAVHGILSIPRFELFLLTLIIPCICQSSAFIIRGGTTRGIIVGSLFIAVAASLLFSICLFLIVTIFTNSFVQYKEVKKTDPNNPWHSKLLFFFTGKPAIGKWFHRDGLPSSFLPRFGILFEDRKGPPIYILAERNDQFSIPEQIDCTQRGIGRMRAARPEDRNGLIKTQKLQRLIGCARSAYIIVDLLRRVGLGIIAGAFTEEDRSHGNPHCILALSITLVQFLYLFFLQPYIQRGVHMVECISLLCEAGIFSLSFYLEHLKRFENQRTVGIVMLSLLFTSFTCQLVNEWYALIKGLLRLPQSPNPSLKQGLKLVSKGLILPLLPRKLWSRLLPETAQLKTGLSPVLSLSPEAELERLDGQGSGQDPVRATTATIVPLASPDMPRFSDQAVADHDLNMESSQQMQGTSQIRRMRIAEGKQAQSKSESVEEMKMLRELAKASFFRGSTSYFTPQ